MTSYSSIILDYLGADVAANRPVSLNIAPTALGLYTATDTGIVSAWYGAAWHVVATEGASVSEIVAGAGLSGGTITTSGTIALGTIAAGDLLGNPGSVAAVPSGVVVGSGLTLSAGGTLTAGGGAGSVTSVVAGSGLSGGTITSAGTIALGTIAAGDLLGNPGSVAAVPSAVAIGSGLSLSALGTLSATGGGTVTNIATTGGISGGPITSTGTLATDWNAGTVTAIGRGLTIDAGHTLQAVKNSRTVSAGFTLAATDSDSLIISNNATANVTITAPSSLGTGFNVELFNQNVGTLVVVPGAGTTLNGGGSTVFPLPIFTSTELVIDATGTNYSAVPGLSFWNPNAGLVTALGSGLAITSGTLNVTGTVAPVVQSYYVPLIPGVPNSSISTSAVAAASKNNKISFLAGQTITAVYIGLNSVVNGGSYVAQICLLNGSNVVQSVTNSDTLVASGTAATNRKFTFNPGVVVNSGSAYAIGCARIDSTGSFVLPVYTQSATTLLGRQMDSIVSSFAVTSAGIANGSTLSAATAPVVMALDITQ